ncbi:D-tyrosyl-tRNA(Tyr) deacylase [Pelotomaculum sp. FP]|uniref:D-aminoacyl-tRNA deacylase n=1 Tax=Pelotomaculum sp. FP TaxID=261474 RepID=UPI001065CFD1|nr:D-aminoacyl-tRNA deacylase [Pelotomaculum sp. FP]TEB13086.1 D-tyrosyl-tRNA(Tyr) deacylase [Pelotomaculum sp. FP]
MRAVVQRVVRGSVTVEGQTMAREIGPGLVVLLGVGYGDAASDACYLAEKIANLRIFEDDQGKMNLSVLDTAGSVLAISQFTLYGDCRKGRRPGFSDAAAPEEALALYNKFVKELEKAGLKVATGCFGEHMVVEIINDGPVTLLVDSDKKF